MNCPSCASPMRAQEFEGHYGTKVELDLCYACTALWFDDKESLHLSPGGTLQLFRAIHEAGAKEHAPQAATPGCPRCGAALVPTQDVQRHTRFNYHRCPKGHGRFITFFQFMREKNFVRNLDVAELNRLKASVKVVHCSNCGAPVELEKGDTCGYCQAPVSALDTEQIQKTVRTLAAEDARKKNVDPTVAAQLIMDKLSAQSFYDRLNPEQSSALTRHRFRGGLVELGLEVVFDVVGALFR